MLSSLSLQWPQSSFRSMPVLALTFWSSRRYFWITYFEKCKFVTEIQFHSTLLMMMPVGEVSLAFPCKSRAVQVKLGPSCNRVSTSPYLSPMPRPSASSITVLPSLTGWLPGLVPASEGEKGWERCGSGIIESEAPTMMTAPSHSPQQRPLVASVVVGGWACGDGVGGRVEVVADYIGERAWSFALWHHVHHSITFSLPPTMSVSGESVAVLFINLFQLLFFLICLCLHVLAILSPTRCTTFRVSFVLVSVSGYFCVLLVS